MWAQYKQLLHRYRMRNISKAQFNKERYSYRVCWVHFGADDVEVDDSGRFTVAEGSLPVDITKQVWQFISWGGGGGEAVELAWIQEAVNLNSVPSLFDDPSGSPSPSGSQRLFFSVSVFQ